MSSAGSEDKAGRTAKGAEAAGRGQNLRGPELQMTFLSFFQSAPKGFVALDIPVLLTNLCTMGCNGT